MERLWTGGVRGCDAEKPAVYGQRRGCPALKRWSERPGGRQQVDLVRRDTAVGKTRFHDGKLALLKRRRLPRGCRVRYRRIINGQANAPPALSLGQCGLAELTRRFARFGLPPRSAGFSPISVKPRSIAPDQMPCRNCPNSLGTSTLAVLACAPILQSTAHSTISTVYVRTQHKLRSSTCCQK